MGETFAFYLRHQMPSDRVIPYKPLKDVTPKNEVWKALKDIIIVAVIGSVFASIFIIAAALTGA